MPAQPTHEENKPCTIFQGDAVTIVAIVRHN